jgi:hypothetical protein
MKSMLSPLPHERQSMQADAATKPRT